MTTKELQDAVSQKQTGEYIPTREETLGNLSTGQNVTRRSPAYEALMEEFPVGQVTSEDYGPKAAMVGWGKSRFDRGIFDENQDLEERRALEQSGFSKILNGTLKGGVYALTTAVETTAGLIDGLFEGLGELGRQISEDKNVDLGKVIGAGVNNTLSRSMLNIQKLSDELLPNYRTLEERSDKYQDEWYKHIFTANFIGDSFLKNFGFTVGAIGGGVVWSKVLSAALRASAANKLLRGVTAAAEGDATAKEALANTLKLIDDWKAGVVSESDIVKNITDASKVLNKMSAEQELIGSIIGAFGEGTMEGIMARDEFVDRQNPEINRTFWNKYQQLETEVINQFKDNRKYVVKVPVGRDSSGRLIEEYQLTADGREILENRQRLVAEDFAANKDYVNSLGDTVAATTFVLNIPILTLSNTLQFGRLFSGGFNTSRKVASNIVGDVAMRDGRVAANLTARGTARGAATRAVAKNAATEMAEEMSQGFVSSGAQRVADSRLTSFNDDGYDEDEMFTFGQWVDEMISGGLDYLKEGRNWQEGFLGMLTGITSSIATREGKAAREAFGKTQALADALNTRINSKEFQDSWLGYIRHQKYETEMGDAIERDDRYSWKTANDKQLISDIIMFADAGRLQDLKDIVDAYANLSDPSEKGAVDMATGELNKSEVQNDAVGKMNSIKEQASDIKEAINMYNAMYNAMRSIAPVDTSDNQIKEMIATAMNIKAFEKRYLSMLDEVITSVGGFIDPIASINPDGTEADAKQKKDNLRNIYSAMAEVYTKAGLPGEAMTEAMAASLLIVNDLEKAIEKHGDDQLKKKMQDLKDVAEDRRAYLRKLTTLRNLPKGKYDKEALTPDKVIDEQKKEKARKDTEGLKTLEDVKKSYFSKNAKERAEFESTLEDAAESNPNIDKFVKLKKRYDEFMDWVKTHPIGSADITVTPPMIQSTLNDLLRRARSVEELLSLPDSAFSSRDSFNLNFQSPFGPTSPSAYESVKAAVRQAMKEFAGVASQTASKETLSSTPVEQQPTGPVSAPDGYDAAQPGSMEPAPDAESSPSEPIVKEEEPEPLVVGRQQTETEMTDDAAFALFDTSPEGSENDSVKVGDKNETAYYHQSVPEISSEEAAKARDAILNKDYEALKEANLQDFVIDNPQFSEIWNALNDRGAFDAVSQINVGDEVELIVDPAFPDYKGKYQILLRNKKTGEILTVLNSNTSKTTYYGIAELRKAIDDEYNSFREENPNDVFVFSKTSTVWAKRPGLIEYGFDAEDEKAIQDIPSYEESAPIVFIDRNGNAVSARGNDSALNHVSLDFTNPARNKGDIDGIDRRGNLYYLAPDGRGNFIPIRLGVEHFKESTKDSDNAVFDRIRKEISAIAEIGSKTNNTNLAEQNEKLHQAVQKLVGDLDISGIYFELGEFENVGVALRINDGEHSVIRRPEQITPEWLVDHMSQYDRSVQIRQNAEGKLQNLKEYISSGVITSNAKMLRAKGVDFYTYPWIAEKGEFGPATSTQVKVKDEINYGKETPDNVGIEDMHDDEFGDRDEDNDFSEPQPTEAQPSDLSIAETAETAQAAITGRRDEDPVIKMLDKPFSKLPKSVRTALEKKGWTADAYNKMRKEQPGLAEKELRCAGA